MYSYCDNVKLASNSVSRQLFSEIGSLKIIKTIKFANAAQQWVPSIPDFLIIVGSDLDKYLLRLFGEISSLQSYRYDFNLLV
jgi:hypothetical protein